jgi:hypothetical protein
MGSSVRRNPPIDGAGIPDCDATKPDGHITMDLAFAGVYLADMKDVAEDVRSRSERIQRVLMVWGALILFALGVLLLLAPKRAEGACSRVKGDNELHRIGTKTCYECAGL